MRHLFVLIVCGLSFPLAHAANEPEDDDAWRRNAPVTSHLKNFVVVGMPKETSLEVAVWAESVIKQIQDWTQTVLPGSYAYPIVIDAEEREDERQGFVIISQQITSGGHLRQGLRIVNLEIVDPEDLLEGLCHLLLNRWIHVRQSNESLAESPGQFPQWFTYGIAQSLYPDLTYRNRQLVEEEESRGRYMPALSIVNHRVLPPGRWAEKAHAGLVMRWVSQNVPPESLVSGAAEVVAGGGSMDEAYLLGLMNADDAFVFNAGWDLWMAKLGRLIVPGITASDIDGLSRILQMRAEDLGLVHPAIPPSGSVPPDLLIKERNEKWARDVCMIMDWKLRLESIGKMMSIQDAIKPYLDFFDLMLAPPKEITRRTSRQSRSVEKPPSTRQLKKMWSKADKGWKKLSENLIRRAAYIDTYEQPAPVSTHSVQEWLDKWQAENL